MRLLKKLVDNVADGQTNQETSNEDIMTRRRNKVQVVTNVRLVWLDNNIDIDNSDCQNTINKLQCAITSIATFIDGEGCIQFLNTISDQKICMVISGALGQGIVPRLDHMSQVDTIFIFCTEKEYHQQWVKNWSKIKGVFTDIDLICDALKQTAQQCEQNSISISFMETTGDITNKKLNQLEPSFMYTQIIKEILLSITFQEQHFQEFVDYCFEALQDNPSQLQNVNKIKRKYQEETPIWWYTYECFLYPMLNRALRTLDTDFIITVGFFIKDLHLQIEQLYKEQFGCLDSNESFVVYRGQGMAKEEFDKMMETKGGLLSFNCFLSTSTKREVSRRFAQRAATNPNLVGILFVMTIDPSQPTTPLAEISTVSCYKNEEEVLFSMHTVFRINDITSMDETQRLFRVDITLTSDNDPDLRVLTDRIREETFPDKEGWYRLGMTLLKMGQWKKADEVYQILLENATTERERATIYNQIGWAKQTQGGYQEAITWYEKSIDIIEKIFPSNHPHLAMSYGNIGSVCSNMGEYSKALSSHEKALAIQQQSLSPNHPDLAMSYGNIGNVYENMGEYPKALSSHKKALAIQQQSLPRNHPDLASTYNNVGNVCSNMGEYSKALLSHEKALEIRQQSLPPNHPDLAATYNNVGLVYRNMREYSKALSSHEKALAIRQQSLPPNHPDLAMSYHNIGLVYSNMGEYSKALASHEKALAIRQQSLPLNHPDLSVSYNNVGMVYSIMGEYFEALASHEKALVIQQQSLPPNHPDLAVSYNNVGLVYTNMGEYSKALASHEKALAIRQQSLPPNHPDLTFTYNGIGCVHEKMGEYSKARSFYERAVEIAQQSLPANHPNRQIYENNLDRIKKLV